MFEIDLTVREGLMLAIGLAGAYALLLVTRLLRAWWRRHDARVPETFHVAHTAPAHDTHATHAERHEPELKPEDAHTPPAATTPPDFGWNLELQKLRRELTLLRERVSGHEDELRRLRADNSRLLADLQALRQSTVRREVEHAVEERRQPAPAARAPRPSYGEPVIPAPARGRERLAIDDDYPPHAARAAAAPAPAHVNPHYQEATRLAREGLTPHQIAEHTGMSITEAELLVAMTRPTMPKAPPGQPERHVNQLI